MSSDSKMIWDLPTRVTHWALALCVALNLFVLEEGDPPHEWAGYVAVGLVVFRFFWGFAGAPASRFSAFPVAPQSVWSYIKNKFSPTGPQIGHNPLASWAYIGIWSLIIALGVTGFMMGLDAFWGDETLEEVHSAMSKGLEILVIVHFAGLSLDGLRKKRHTWTAMFTGRR